MTTTNTPEPIYYEVLWGIEEHERTMRVDYRDGMAYSEHAEALATRVFLEMAKSGCKVGFSVNGVHKAGHEFVEEWAAADAAYAAEASTEQPVVHETLTGLHSHGGELRINWSNLKPVYDRSAWAKCTCGWSETWDNREIARWAARQHREQMAVKAGAA